MKTNRADGKAVVTSTSVAVARADYRCYGCMGECPIERGDKYLKVNIRHNGKTESKRLCQRCWIALENRMVFSDAEEKTFDGEGCFRFSRLSSPFRRTWNAMCRELGALTPEEREGKRGTEVQDRYLDMLIPREKWEELNQLDKTKQNEQKKKEEQDRADDERAMAYGKRLARAKRNASAARKGVLSLCKACIGLKAKLYGLGMGKEEVETALADVYAGRAEIQKALEKMEAGLKEGK